MEDRKPPFVLVERDSDVEHLVLRNKCCFICKSTRDYWIDKGRRRKWISILQLTQAGGGGDQCYICSDCVKWIEQAWSDIEEEVRRLKKKLNKLLKDRRNKYPPQSPVEEGVKVKMKQEEQDDVIAIEEDPDFPEIIPVDHVPGVKEYHHDFIYNDDTPMSMSVEEVQNYQGEEPDLDLPVMPMRSLRQSKVKAIKFIKRNLEDDRGRDEEEEEFPEEDDIDGKSDNDFAASDQSESDSDKDSGSDDDDEEEVAEGRLAAGQHRQRHQKIRHPAPAGKKETEWKCSVCKETFAIRYRLVVHEITECGVEYSEEKLKESRVNLFRCDKCPRIFGKKLSLIAHYSSHLDSPIFKCTSCGKMFLTRTDFNKHRKKTGHSSWKADTSQMGDLLRKMKHERNKPPEPKKINPKKCTECDKIFKNYDGLRSHRNVHHSEKIVCQFCGKEFKPYRLQNHIDVWHSEESALGSAKKSVCSICGRSVMHLKHHISTVHNPSNRVYVCHVCGVTLGSYDLMQNHKRMHLRQSKDTRKFPCELCDFKFYDKRHLEWHVNSWHPKEDKPKLPCERCGQLFSFPHLLRKHQEARPDCHTREYKIHRFQAFVQKCPFCEEVIRGRFAYKSHLKQMHEDQDIGPLIEQSKCEEHLRRSRKKAEGTSTSASTSTNTIDHQEIQYFNYA